MSDPLVVPGSSFRARIRSAIEGITRRAETLRLTAINLDNAVGELPSAASALELRQAAVAVESSALHAILDATTIAKHAGAISAFSELRDVAEAEAPEPRRPRRPRARGRGT